MITLLLFFFMIQLILLILIEKRLQQPTAVIWMLLIPFLLVPMAVDNSFGSHENLLERSATINALSFIIFANFAYLLTLLYSHHLFGKIATSELPFFKRGSPSQSTTLAVAMVCILMASGVGLNRILESDLSDKRSLGLLYLLLVWLICMSAGPLLKDLNEKNYGKAFVLASVALLLVMYFRSRSLIAVYFMSWVFITFVHKKSSFKTIMIFTCAGITAFGLSVLLKAVRYMGSLSNLKNIDQLWENISTIAFKSFETGDLSIYKYMTYLFQNCPEMKDLCQQQTILNKILSKTGFAEAPVKTLEYSLYDVYAEAGVGGSLHPTIYGIAYGDNGWIGGIIFFSFLAFINKLFSDLYRHNFNVYYMGFMAYYVVFVARGSFYNALIISLVGILLSYAFVKIARSVKIPTGAKNSVTIQ